MNILESIVRVKDEASATLKEVNKSVNALSGDLQSLGQKSAIAGAAITASMGFAIHSTVAYAESIDRLVKMNDVAAETLGKLGYAAEQEGSSLQGLGIAFKFLGRSMASAAEGSAETQRYFNKLGIEIKDAYGNVRNVGDVFTEMTEKMGNLGSAGERTKVLMSLLGRSGAELAPFFKMGADEIARLGDEARKLGIVLSGKEVKQLETLGDQFTTVKKGIQGVRNELTISLIPNLLFLSVVITEVLKSVIGWMREHRELVKILGTTAGILGILLTAFGSFAVGAATIIGTFKGISMGVGLIKAGAEALVPILGFLLNSVIGPMASGLAVVGTALASVTLQVWAIIAAVVAVSALLYEFRSQISDFFSGLMADSKVVGGWILDVIKGILEWVGEAILKIPVLGAKFGEFFTNAKENLGTFLSNLMEKGGAAFTWIKTGAINIGSGISEKIGDVIQSIKEKIKDLPGEFGNVFNDIWGKVDEMLAKANEASEAAKEQTKTWKDEFVEGWVQAQGTVTGIFQKLGGAAYQLYDGMMQGFGQAMAQVIMQGKSFAEVMKGIMSSLLQNILAQIITMLSKYIVEKTIAAYKSIAIDKAEAASGAMKAHSGIPFVGYALGVAAALATMAFITGIAKFGDGGIVTKPTLAIVGEKGPERITPLVQEKKRAGSGNLSGAVFQINVTADSSAGSLEEITEAARAGTSKAIEAALLMARLADENSSKA